MKNQALRLEVKFSLCLSIAAKTSAESKHFLSVFSLKQLLKRRLCVWNLKGQDPHSLLNAVGEEVTLKEIDAEHSGIRRRSVKCTK